MGGLWGEMPFVAMTSCFAAGILLSAPLHSYHFSCLALAGSALACAALLAFHRGRTRACLGLALCTLALGGTLAGLAERDGYGVDDVRARLQQGSLPLGTPVLIDAWVLEDSAQRGLDSVTTVSMRGLQHENAWIRCTGKLELRVAVPEEPGVPAPDFRYGDRLRAWVECYLPRNFQNPGSADRVGFLARRGIHLLARAKSPRLIEVLPGDAGTPWGRATSAGRRFLRSRLRDSLPERSRAGAVLASIVLGDYADLDSETRTAFQNTGTYHILVVSGLHVSWIAWVLIRLLGLMRVPSRLSLLLSGAGILLYASLVGFQASISRALWTFSLYLGAQAFFREASPGNTLPACAFLLLAVHPAWLFDTGFQLSFLAVAAIVFMAIPGIERVVRPLLDPLRHAGISDRLSLAAGTWHRRGRRLRFLMEVWVEACADRTQAGMERPLMLLLRTAGRFSFLFAGTVAASLSVQAWLEPVFACYFNRLSWIAPAANLVVVPLASFTLAAGMAAEALSCLLPGAGIAFQWASTPAELLLRTNRWFADLPGAWQRCPTLPGLWVAAGLLIMFCWCFLRWRRAWIPCLLVFFELSFIALVGRADLPVSSPKPSEIPSESSSMENSPLLRLSFLDVGQGDCAVLHFPDGRVWVVDAGGLRLDPVRPDEEPAFDVGEAVVSRFLWSRLIARLDRAVLSHPHQDHAGGMPALLRNFVPRRLDHGNGGGEPLQSRVLEEAHRQGVATHTLERGEEYRTAGVVVSVLHPATGYRPDSLNNGSVVLRIEFGRFTALLAGDLERAGEAVLLSGLPDVHSLFLKVAHHGSRNATSDRFLDRVQPRWALISAARNNPFGNPSPETLNRILRQGARPLLTMDQGAVFFETDGTHYRLSSYTLGVLEQGLLPISR